MDLGDRGDLVIHLRMSGQLRMERSAAEIPYTRLRLALGDGRTIYFVNPRRLGTAVLCPEGFSASLGFEPLESAFTAERFSELAAASRAPIKSLLLDQKKIAGIGNIYAAEALWRAGIHPGRRSNALTRKEIARLHRAIVTVLQEAVDQLGTTLGRSVSDYRPSASDSGGFQNHLAVYGREGESCERCRTPIERMVQAGRSTCYCPACQT
jgi:formamidopyrimidine-DNA glycosylase